MNQRTVIQALASAIEARANVIGHSSCPEMVEAWDEVIQAIQREKLPSGSGIDGGTAVTVDKSSGRRIEMLCSFHHMDEHGFYYGWTDHRIVATPAFDGIDVVVYGPHRNGIKDYLHDTYYHALMEDCTGWIAATIKRALDNAREKQS